MRESRRFFATACCSAVAAFACGRHASEAGSVEASALASATTAASATALAPAAGSTADTSEPAALEPYLVDDPVAAKSIGHTSYVLQLRLRGGARAVFKPRSTRPLGDWRYKGEIAAYRLAVALGLDNVPRAIPRAFDAASLRTLLGPPFDREAIVDGDGKVRGALMPWIDGYRVLPLETAAQRARWDPWVFDPRVTVSSEDVALASAISTMIAFDYLTANWDRWSGGNVAQDGDGGRVLYVDNDGAFYEYPDASVLARQRRDLERVARFSRRFVERLRALDDAALRAALGEEQPGTPLLSERAMAGVAARRRVVLSIVNARADAAGEPSWP
jgi:hypothetical protein